ncbi:hypothetical protein CVT24_007168 [Panaeolus cyanescens]|uniref:Uncharacterized protein n=1 Tax=Panaeolus cyanescens TaxID=181874 RepID=A0A409YPJ0_9AGAR|nr:hypothetical protein CVT24_007168 [Panaeolus cyanescens]
MGHFPQIKHLYLDDGIACEEFPVSFLSKFPSLVTLKITEDCNAERPSLRFRADGFGLQRPSFNLETLHLNSGPMVEGITDVLEFYLQHAKRNGVKAFKSLKDLDVVLANEGDWNSMKALFEDEPALQSLSMDGGHCYLSVNKECGLTSSFIAGTIPGSHMELDDFIPLSDYLIPSASTLNHLSLSFPIFWLDGALEITRFQNTVAIITDNLLAAMADRSVLKSLNLTFRLGFSEKFTCPNVRQWQGFASSLASREVFPSLKEVGLEMIFIIDGEHGGEDDGTREVVEEFQDGELCTFGEKLDEALDPLHKRRDVKVAVSLDACTSWSQMCAIIQEVV